MLDGEQQGSPSGIVTFLFTDIEGSTRRWEADPDVMRVALETHNKVLRASVEANDGHVFNYAGDGMCAGKSLSRTGENMTSAEMATYALDQIEQARTDLLRADGST